MGKTGKIIKVYFCPACPVQRSTQKEIIDHAKTNHGLSRNEATGGWNRPADWDRFDKANIHRKFRHE